MTRPTLAAWLGRQPAALRRGPIAVLMLEGSLAAEETIAHHLALGFRHVIALSRAPVALPEGAEDRVTCLDWQAIGPAVHAEAVNAIIAAVPEGTWLYYGWNAEFLFFPFCETRRVGDLLAFHAEERRDAMLTCVVDLYPRQRNDFPDRISREDAFLDQNGYYALARLDREGQPLERQYDIFGGLRWRFEEHLPRDRLRLDRVALFRAAKGLRLLADHRFNVEEYNTISCVAHHNLTAAVVSFRVARALASNPGPRGAIRRFDWEGSIPFGWTSRHLMDLGMMEPGQWF